MILLEYKCDMCSDSFYEKLEGYSIEDFEKAIDDILNNKESFIKDINKIKMQKKHICRFVETKQVGIARLLGGKIEN